MGASVELLSQYAGELEVLFPPLCILRVRQRQPPPPLAREPPLAASASALEHVDRPRDFTGNTTEAGHQVV